MKNIIKVSDNAPFMEGSIWYKPIATIKGVKINDRYKRVAGGKANKKEYFVMLKTSDSTFFLLDAYPSEKEAEKAIYEIYND